MNMGWLAHLGGCFAICASQRDHAFVDLDAWNDALLLEDLDKGDAFAAVLVQGLLKQDLQGTRWLQLSSV